jgi:hypothetical protein
VERAAFASQKGINPFTSAQWDSWTPQTHKEEGAQWSHLAEGGGLTRYDVDHTIFIYCIQIYSSHEYNE